MSRSRIVLYGEGKQLGVERNVFGEGVGADEGRSKLRSVLKDAWWPYVCSNRIRVTVGRRGVVQWNGLRMPTQCRHGERTVVCDHLDGTVSILQREPHRDELSVVLFTDRAPRR